MAPELWSETATDGSALDPAWVRERAAYYGVSTQSPAWVRGLREFVEGTKAEVMPAPNYAKVVHECTCWPAGASGHDSSCPVWDKS